MELHNQIGSGVTTPGSSWAILTLRCLPIKSTNTSPITSTIPEIKNILNNSDLNDLGFFDNPFTWTNRESNDGIIKPRLYMVMDNGMWLSQYCKPLFSREIEKLSQKL